MFLKPLFYLAAPPSILYGLYLSDVFDLYRVHHLNIMAETTNVVDTVITVLKGSIL